jgi:hypothetical protein
MYFLTNEETDSVKVMNVLHFLEKKEAQNTNSNQLVAYRFSPEELLKMIELKEILQSENEKLNFKFEFDRFPEVYFTNIKDKLNNDLKIKDNKNTENGEIDLYKYVNSKSFNIDKLGVYRTSKTKLGCLNVTNEGVIILYEDVIKVYAECKKINEKDLRLKVLLHELGHWVSHWPIANKSNWRIGYNTLHKKTHEAIAQIITYKLIEGNDELENLFEVMRHEKEDSPYRLYENLITQDISEILNKIVDLRKHHYLNDSAQYRYLADASLNYIDNPMLMHLKTCLIFNESLEAISDCTIDQENILLIKEGLKNDELESLKVSLSSLRDVSKKTNYNKLTNQLNFLLLWMN